MSTLRGSTILVTGGASGIGRRMVENALQRGAHQVMVWDVNDQKLQETVTSLRNGGHSVYTQRVDVSHTATVQEAAKRVQQELGPVDILINNAGVVVGKMFHEHSHQEVDFTLSINTAALMHLTLEFLPEMIRRRKGHIVNIASAAGLVANPKMSVYCGSKWAVVGWSDSLRLEMEQLDTGVHVTTVMPYYIDTGMFAGVRSWIPILKPEPVARKILDAVERDRVFLRLPWLVNLLPATRGALPFRLFDWLVGDLLGVYRSMNEFVGHRKESE